MPYALTTYTIYFDDVHELTESTTMDLETIKALKEIKTPLAFLSLVVLISEAVLLYLMTKVSGGNLTILISGVMQVIILSSIIKGMFNHL